MYLNQICCVNWNNKNSTDFSVSNVVKQGAVISPIVFRAYMDKLFKQFLNVDGAMHFIYSHKYNTNSAEDSSDMN